MQWLEVLLFSAFFNVYNITFNSTLAYAVRQGDMW